MIIIGSHCLSDPEKDRIHILVAVCEVTQPVHLSASQYFCAIITQQYFCAIIIQSAIITQSSQVLLVKYPLY